MNIEQIAVLLHDEHNYSTLIPTTDSRTNENIEINIVVAIVTTLIDYNIQPYCTTTTILEYLKEMFYYPYSKMHDAVLPIGKELIKYIKAIDVTEVLSRI